MKRSLLLAAAVAMGLGLGGPSAHAQPAPPTVNVGALAGLPADVQGSLTTALQSGNDAQIANAIAAAIAEYPALAAQIAGQSAQARPSSASLIAGAAARAAVANNSPPGAITGIAASVTTAAPTDAAGIAVAVFGALPPSQQTPANQQAIAQIVIASAAAAGQGNEQGPVTAALGRVAPNDPPPTPPLPTYAPPPAVSRT